MGMAEQREALIDELNQIVDAMADRLSFSQAERLTIVLTPDESDVLAFSMGSNGEFIATVDCHGRVWYCGKRIMVEEKKDGA